MPGDPMTAIAMSHMENRWTGTLLLVSDERAFCTKYAVHHGPPRPENSWSQSAGAEAASEGDEQETASCFDADANAYASTSYLTRTPDTRHQIPETWTGHAITSHRSDKVARGRGARIGC